MKTLPLLLFFFLGYLTYAQTELGEDPVVYVGKETVWDLEYFHSNHIIAGTAHGNLIKLNDNGKELLKVKVQDGPIHDIAISDNDSLLALVDYTKGFTVVSTSTFEKKHQKEFGSGVSLVEWLPGSDKELLLLITSSSQSKISIYNLEKKAITKTLFEKGSSDEHPVEISFSPDGSKLAIGTANKNHSVHFYSTKDWSKVKSLSTSNDVNAFCWEGEDHFFIGTLDNTVEKYSYNDLKLAWRKDFGSSFPSSMDLNQHQQLAVCGFQYGFMFKVYDAKTGKEMQEIGDKNPRGNVIKWSSAGDQLAIGITTYGDVFNAGIVQVFNSKDKAIEWFKTNPTHTGIEVAIPVDKEPILKSDNYYDYATYNMYYGGVSFQVYAVKCKRPISSVKAKERVDRATQNWKDRKNPSRMETETRMENGFHINEFEASVGKQNYYVVIMHNGSYELTLTAKTEKEKNEKIERFLSLD